MLTRNSFFSRTCHPDHSLMKIKEVFDERSELTGCEGTQAAFKIDASTSLSMTFKRWVNCYIVTL